jgi:hypothetical protein
VQPRISAGECPFLRSLLVPRPPTYPSIGPVLDPLDDGQSLVVAPLVPVVRVRVEHRRPQHGPAPLGPDAQPQPGELGLAPLLDVVQVQVKGEDPRPDGADRLRWRKEE